MCVCVCVCVFFFWGGGGGVSFFFWGAVGGFGVLGGFWGVLGGFGAFWGVLGGFGGFWGVLGVLFICCFLVILFFFVGGGGFGILGVLGCWGFGVLGGWVLGLTVSGFRVSVGVLVCCVLPLLAGPWGRGGPIASPPQKKREKNTIFSFAIRAMQGLLSFFLSPEPSKPKTLNPKP